LYRHGVGLTGDEDLFSCRLTSSLDDSWVNALTLSSFTPVQPVALAVFTWPSSMHQCLAIDLTDGRLAVQPVLILVQFSTLLSSFFDSYFARALYSSLGPNMIHLINLLVPLIMLSLNHQNHKQWPNGDMFLTHYINRSSSKLLEAYSLNLLTITMETSKSKNIHTTSSPPFFLQIW
jgi:hypothetical protein